MSESLPQPNPDGKVPAAQYRTPDLVRLALSYDEDSVITAPKCKVCMAACRHEAEAYWEKTQRNIHATVRYLKDEYDFDISNKPLKNHMVAHYLPQLTKMGVKTYAEGLSEYLNLRNDRLAEIAVCKAMLNKEMLQLAAENQNERDQHNRRKNLELIIKMISQLMSCQDAERKHEEEWKPVNIIIEKLQQIIQIEQTQGPPEYQERLIRVVDTLIEEIDHANIDTK